MTGEKRNPVTVWLSTQHVRGYVMLTVEGPVGRSTVLNAGDREKRSWVKQISTCANPQHVSGIFSLGMDKYGMIYIYA